MKWLVSLRDFKTTYLLPLQRRIDSSPWVRKEIEQAEGLLETAARKLHRRFTSGEMRKILREDQLRAASMLVERRSKSSAVAGEMGAGSSGGSAGRTRGGLVTATGDGRKGVAPVAVRDFAVGQAGMVMRRGTRVRREHTM